MPDSETAIRDELADVLHIRRARRRTITIVALAIFVVGLLTVLLLLVKTVTVNIAPARALDSSALVSTKGFSIALGRNVHFFGAIEVEAVAEGFYPETLALDRTTESPVSITLQPRPGSISIELNFLQDESRSEYSLVANDTQLYEVAPETIELPAGPHELRVQGPHEYDSTQFVEVIGYGEKQVVSFVALPRGSFSIKVLPDIAEIKLNGTSIGTGEVRQSIVAKSHLLEFELEGYVSKRLPFAVEANSHLDLGTVNLASAPGTVNFVSKPPAASIFVDGQFVGSTPVQLEFDKSSVKVELRKPNFHTETSTVQIVPGDTITREFKLEEIRFDVKISALPKASLGLNDKRVGSTPQTVNVTAGDVLVVSKEGYASQSITIAQKEHQAEELYFELVDLAQQEYNEAPELVRALDSIQLKKFPSAKFRLLVPGYLMEDNRQRVREFEITRPFYFGVHEIRRKEYAEYDTSLKTTAADENLPVTDISWLDAAKFCNWLSASEGLSPVYAIGSGASVSIDLGSNGYRLPTEAEWELITYYNFKKEEIVGPFVWGEGTKPPSQVGNLAGFETRSALRGHIEDYADSHRELAPVGSYRRNFNAIHDLVGNAAEWVFDYFGSTYEGWDKPLIDPMGPSRGIDRIVKGANFQTTKLHEAAINFRRTVGFKDETVGFRIARWVL
ncbi:MAG: SUMF1/EgtB/PvdO family nonheme iron enzyme [Gammaproteobacteria bacterium]|nr:SUMF1/EgtB/PvdO family nonheme iron enzyme [Gammaproteobacteria bacterium]MYI77083.1 SUMF1/EgtB/PvdO family nonheme iron enzyme [Gammaproteobacteria bacterium]